jgi:hypothetical protein
MSDDYSNLVQTQYLHQLRNRVRDIKARLPLPLPVFESPSYKMAAAIVIERSRWGCLLKSAVFSALWRIICDVLNDITF